MWVYSSLCERTAIWHHFYFKFMMERGGGHSLQYSHFLLCVVVFFVLFVLQKIFFTFFKGTFFCDIICKRNFFCLFCIDMLGWYLISPSQFQKISNYFIENLSARINVEHTIGEKKNRNHYNDECCLVPWSPM